MSLQRVAPRKNPLLPFVKTDKNGKLTYIRKIPAELRPFLGNKGAIRRTLGTDSTDVTSSSVLAAYGAVHGEVDALIKGAERKASEASALMTVDSTAIRPIRALSLVKAGYRRDCGAGVALYPRSGGEPAACFGRDDQSSQVFGS